MFLIYFICHIFDSNSSWLCFQQHKFANKCVLLASKIDANANLKIIGINLSNSKCI